MLNGASKDIKYKRIVFYYDELTRHRIDYETALQFMEYQFNVSRNYLVQIIKDYHKYNKAIKLEHADIDTKAIEAFVQKLFKKAKDDRQMELKFDNGGSAVHQDFFSKSP